MTSPPLVLLDACVLANFSLCDTLLRLAEPPPVFEPKWSAEIIRETTRTLESKLRWPSSLTNHFESELFAHFGEACVNVLAAAAHIGAATIVTLNLRHFKPEHLKPWGIRALHPQSFLVEIFREDQMLVIQKLEQQAADRGRSLQQLLNVLAVTVPDFVAIVTAVS